MDRRLFIAFLAAGLTRSAAARAGPMPADLLGAAADPYFADWLNAFYDRALATGVARALLDRELSGLSPDPRVVALDGKQPEFARPVSDYVKGAISADRIAAGRARRAAMAVWQGLENTHGVPRDILIAIWAMESQFGQMQGSLDVIRCLATLAALGRRRGWAEGELLAALTIIGTGQAPRSRLTGSWAGAMGQTQMLPSTYLSTAVDGDGDGRRDIWGSAPDALASAANLLAKGGWVRGQGWTREVLLPAGFDYGLGEGDSQTPAGWRDLGVRPADGGGWTAANVEARCQLLLPCGAGGPAFLALPNHFAIRRYNNSLAYALTVGLLADRFAGGGPLATPWPHETPLSLTDRMAAQTALAAQGFNPGPVDGVIGLGARRALRAWQKARGLPADGYLSPPLVGRLRSGV